MKIDIKNRLDSFSFFITYCIKNDLNMCMVNDKGTFYKVSNVCYNKEKEALFIDASIGFGNKPERIVLLGLERFEVKDNCVVYFEGANNPDGFHIHFPYPHADCEFVESMFARFMANKISYKTHLEMISARI